MRIIGGYFKGKKILEPKDKETRPLKDLTKESIFNIINHSKKFKINLENSTVLDLFSGTGNISYEFASRGTVDLTAVDQNRNCARFITATSDALDAGIHVVQADAMQYVRRASTSFDLIFADPPYDWEHHESLVKSILDIGLLSKGGEAVIEHSNQTDLSNLPGFFAHRKYGHVNFSFFSRPQDVAAED